MDDVEFNTRRTQRRDVYVEILSNNRSTVNSVGSSHRGYRSGTIVKYRHTNQLFTAGDEVRNVDGRNAEVEVLKREDHDVVEIPVVDVVAVTREVNAELHTGLTHVGGGDLLAHRPCTTGVITLSPAIMPVGTAIRRGGDTNGVGARVVTTKRSGIMKKVKSFTFR